MVGIYSSLRIRLATTTNPDQRRFFLSDDVKHLLKILKYIMLNCRYGFKLGSLVSFCMFYPAFFHSLLNYTFLEWNAYVAEIILENIFLPTIQ